MLDRSVAVLPFPACWFWDFWEWSCYSAVAACYSSVSVAVCFGQGYSHTKAEHAVHNV